MEIIMVEFDLACTIFIIIGVVGLILDIIGAVMSTISGDGEAGGLLLIIGNGLVVIMAIGIAIFN